MTTSPPIAPDRTVRTMPLLRRGVLMDLHIKMNDLPRRRSFDAAPNYGNLCVSALRH